MNERAPADGNNNNSNAIRLNFAARVRQIRRQTAHVVEIIRKTERVTSSMNYI